MERKIFKWSRPYNLYIKKTQNDLLELITFQNKTSVVHLGTDRVNQVGKIINLYFWKNFYCMLETENVIKF